MILECNSENYFTSCWGGIPWEFFGECGQATISWAGLFFTHLRISGIDFEVFAFKTQELHTNNIVTSRDDFKRGVSHVTWLVGTGFVWIPETWCPLAQSCLDGHGGACRKCRMPLIILVQDVKMCSLFSFMKWVDLLIMVWNRSTIRKQQLQKHPSFLGFVVLTFKMRRSSFCPTQGTADSLGASFFHATGGGGALWFCDAQRMGSWDISQMLVLSMSKTHLRLVNTVDDSEIWQTPVEIGRIYHYLQGFIHPGAGFLPSTVCLALTTGQLPFWLSINWPFL